MASFQSVKMGIIKYLDKELMEQIQGWRKWIVGAGLSMYMEKGVELFNSLKANPLIKGLEIIDENDDINIDEIYEHLMKEAQKSAVTFKSGIIGDITLKAEDVEKMYHYIKEYC